jgi:hypothetical protein
MPSESLGFTFFSRYIYLSRVLSAPVYGGYVHLDVKPSSPAHPDELITLKIMKKRVTVLE